MPDPLSRIYGYDVRVPYSSEDTYFKKNIHVTGMAADDGRIVLNPYSRLDDNQKRAVAQNEAIRLFIRESKPKLDFEITPEQKKLFAGTMYAQPENENDLRATILARAFSGDASSGVLNEGQKQWLTWLQQQVKDRK